MDIMESVKLSSPNELKRDKYEVTAATAYRGTGVDLVGAVDLDGLLREEGVYVEVLQLGNARAARRLEQRAM